MGIIHGLWLAQYDTWPIHNHPRLVITQLWYITYLKDWSWRKTGKNGTVNSIANLHSNQAAGSANSQVKDTWHYHRIEGNAETDPLMFQIFRVTYFFLIHTQHLLVLFIPYCVSHHQIVLILWFQHNARQVRFFAIDEMYKIQSQISQNQRKTKKEKKIRKRKKVENQWQNIVKNMEGDANTGRHIEFVIKRTSS